MSHLKLSHNLQYYCLIPYLQDSVGPAPKFYYYYCCYLHHSRMLGVDRCVEMVLSRYGIILLWRNLKEGKTFEASFSRTRQEPFL